MKPTIYMLSGPSGVGKSTIAKQISNKLKIKSFTTDDIRRFKEFYEEYSKYRKAGKNFHWTFRKKINLKLLKLAESEIKKGKSVILDATFSKEWIRKLAKDFAKKIKAKLVYIEVTFGDLTDEQAIQRYKDRLKKDSGAALPEVYYIYKKYYSPAKGKKITLSNDKSLSELKRKVDKILEKI